MKKHLKTPPMTISLGELIATVSDCSRSNRETIAAVVDLLETGRVQLSSHGRKVRARVY